ncbi:MAG: hypothetical protein IJA32_05610 [Lachnospiraceae bacterium]|nr:hypothetical protein [Lachnospiraceae bacterium]
MNKKKKELVFLPYKASMWDCFQSIYEAAMQDEEWNVVVLPIPYYNIGKDREILEEYYEGEDFPKDVMIIDYKKYSIEERKPDVIFYHNPYDQHNLVTQIPEKYYSSSLKNYCDHLVYVPYDVVCQNIDPSRCLMPGVQNAWRIIVENEKVLEQYVQYGNISRDKLVALGSPKFDCVSAAEQRCEIPEEWTPILQGKKVFLYNTHLNDLINKTYDLMKKILYLIDFFEEENEVALLWRPHPLSLETIKSFHPEFYEIYEEIVEKAKKGKHIVYDDTPDLECSIAIADAYLGPQVSSVSSLFEAAKKPMLYTDTEISDCKDSKRFIKGLATAVTDTKMYLYSGESNVICIADRNSGEIEVVKGMDGVPAGEPLIATSGIAWKDKIYFISENENYLMKFDTVTKEIKQIYVEKEYNDYNPVVWNGKILFFPVYYTTKIPCIDLNTDEINYLSTCYDKQLNIDATCKGVPLFRGNIEVDNVIYRVCRIAPIIQKYYLEEQRFEYVTIKSLTNLVRDIVYDGKFFWLILQEESSILKWDEKKNHIVDVIDLDEYMEEKGSRWTSGCCENQEIYLWQRNGSHIAKIDLKTQEINCFDCRAIEGFECKSNVQAFSENLCSMGGELMLFPWKANGIVSLTQDGNVFFTKTEVETNAMLGLFQNEQIYNESMCSVKQFVHIVLEQKRRKIEGIRNVGYEIWNEIKNKL